MGADALTRWLLGALLFGPRLHHAPSETRAEVSAAQDNWSLVQTEAWGTYTWGAKESQDYKLLGWELPLEVFWSRSSYRGRGIRRSPEKLCDLGKGRITSGGRHGT